MIRRKEIDLLINGTSVCPGPGQISNLREQVESGIDWSELFRIAIPHGVLPLLSRNLTTYAANVIPPATCVQLERFSNRVAERSREQSIELVKLITALSRDGFRALPFKGPVLAQTFYGDMGLRESHDLDLWIDPSQFGRAMEWFRERGYRPVHHVKGVAEELRSHQAIQEEFLNPDGNVVVEIKAHLEWTEASVFDPPFEQAWNRRGNILFNGIEIPTIASEDLLPSLAVHGAKHFWRRLNWIVDVAAVISSRPELDWKQVMSCATEWRCRRRLLTAVALAAAFYDIQIPEEISMELQKSAVRATVAHIRATLFEQKLHTFTGIGSQFLYCLRSSDSINERLRYVRSSRHFLGRILQADEKRMMLPMSDDLRRVYSAFATVRNWFRVADTKAR